MLPLGVHMCTEPLSLQQVREAAVVMDPEIMAYGPPDAGFDPQYKKSACWPDNNGELRCLPGLVMAGVFHTGAGSLYERVVKHPHIIVVGVGYRGLPTSATSHGALGHHTKIGTRADSTTRATSQLQSSAQQ